MEATHSSVIKQAIRPCCLNLTRSVLLFFFFCHFFFLIYDKLKTGGVK